MLFFSITVGGDPENTSLQITFGFFDVELALNENGSV